jgi:hypothetical protein
LLVTAGRPRAPARVVQHVRVDPSEKPVVLPEGADARVGLPQFVVADEQRQAIGSGEGGHAVVAARHEEAVVHRLARARQHLVGEAIGQVHDARGVRDQLAVTGEAPRPAGRERPQPQEGERHGTGAFQEASS